MVTQPLGQWEPVPRAQSCHVANSSRRNALTCSRAWLLMQVARASVQHLEEHLFCMQGVAVALWVTGMGVSCRPDLRCWA